VLGRLHAAAELRSQRLHAIADAQDGHAQTNDRIADRGRTLGEDGLRAAGQNNARRAEGGCFRRRQIVRANLAINACFANPAGDELRVLAAVVEYQNTGGIGRAALMRERWRDCFGELLVTPSGNWAVPS